MATTFTSNLSKTLPTPKNTVESDDDEADNRNDVLLDSMSKRYVAPPYLYRKGWKPSTQQDFGDGGSFPECHIAQYPLDLGRKKNKSSKTLSLTVDGHGKVKYDAIAKQGKNNPSLVQSSFQDVLPLSKRTDVVNKDMERPSESEVQATADKTKAALEKIVGSKIKATQSKNQSVGQKSQTQYIRYTPNEGSQRVIQMKDAVEDPLEPPRFKHKKVPRGPPSPPPPILRSPPRKATAAEQKEWMIPPCISNWKNNKGYTIPLDKRLAADGRGLQDVQINDNFAKFSEALFIGERHAREEVRERNILQQRLAEKEKISKEENLRQLAQKAREERSSSSRPTMPLADYGSDSDESESESEGEQSRHSDDEDEEGAMEREQMRREKRNEREREMRLTHMGHEQRAKQQAREQNRDISEKVALGLAKPTMSKEAMFDSRLYNRESYSTSFGDDEAYNLYDKPLFHSSEAAAAIYKHRNQGGDDDLVGGGTDEGVSNALKNDRFGLGQPTSGKGFEGADLQQPREGPVEFEKDDPFGVDQFLNDAMQNAQQSNKRAGLDSNPNESRKRQRGQEDDN